jgi:hypothetical protein
VREKLPDDEDADDGPQNPPSGAAEPSDPVAEGVHGLRIIDRRSPMGQERSIDRSIISQGSMA